MWASAFTALVSRIAREAGCHIDAGRRQQRVAERLRAARTAPGRPSARPDSLDDLAHQRIAVRVHARRGKAEHHVARGDIGARQQRAALGGADRKAREIVVAVLVEAGHFGGLAADQRAAGLAGSPRRRP